LMQFAGLTVGKTQSYFDLAAHAWSYGHGYAGAGPDTPQGRLVAAYTATLGNGVSATLSLEDATSRRGALWDAGTNSLAIGSFPGPNGWGFTGLPSWGLTLVTPDAHNNILHQAGGPPILGRGLGGRPPGPHAPP